MNYYNDHDPAVADWLEGLVKDNLIPQGVVDRRCLLDVLPSDLSGFTQCHFFAGIGGWSRAFQLAGIDPDEPVWSGSPPCFPAGTLVMTRHGQVPIEKISVGDEVLTHRARWRRVTHIGGARGKPLVRVKGHGHSGLVCTPNHPFLTDLSEWTPAADLVGKRWRTVASVPFSAVPSIAPTRGVWRVGGRWRANGSKGDQSVYLGTYDTPEQAREARLSAHADGRISLQGADAADETSLGFARFLGFWVGNGWTTGHNVLVCDDVKDEALVREIVSGAGLAGCGSYERTAFRYAVGSKSLASWLTTHFGAGASNKKIPAWLHGATEQYREAFLRGYVEADGYSGGEAVTASTTSRALMVGLRILFNQFKVAVSVRLIENNRECVIEGRRVKERPYYRLSIHPRPLQFHFDDLHGIGTVRCVEDAGVGDVYNLAVEEDHTYVADGIVVHNCQPWSVAGQGKGADDERHLAPAFVNLVAACRPPIVFGEQVASSKVLGRASGAPKPGDPAAWVDDLFDRLEDAGYACGAADLPAAGVGAPHIRQRCWFIARRLADAVRLGPETGLPTTPRRHEGHANVVGDGRSGLPRSDQGQSSTGRLADADGRYACAEGLQRGGEQRQQPKDGRVGGLDHAAGARHLGPQSGAEGEARDEARLRLSGEGRGLGRVADAERRAAERHGYEVAGAAAGVQGAAREQRLRPDAGDGGAGCRPSPTDGFWRDADWLHCRDGKWRPVEPGTFPLAHGLPTGMGKLSPRQQRLAEMAGLDAKSLKRAKAYRVISLRGYGNAIVPEVAAAFIQAALTC